jgi:hypothetical protein
MPVIAIITLENIIDYLKAEPNNEQLNAIKDYQQRYGI